MGSWALERNHENIEKDCRERKWNGVFGGINYVSHKHGREDARHGWVLFGWRILYGQRRRFFIFYFYFLKKESVYLLLCGEEEGSKFSFPFGRS